MVNSIGLKNIRVFKKWQEFKLTPYTILTGTNDSGKSTLQKMLVLLSAGFEKMDDGLCNFERLHFDNANLELTGDFLSNVNYNSRLENLEFSFEFEDDFFGLLKAEISYEKEANSLIATANKIVFKKDNVEIISFVKRKVIELLEEIEEKDFSVEVNENHEIWSMSKETQKVFSSYVRNLLLKKRGESIEQQKIKTLSIKIANNQELTNDEKIFKKKMDSEGFIFLSEHAESDESKEYPIIVLRNGVMSKFGFDKELEKIYETFKSPYDNILIHSELVDLVLGEENILECTNNSKYKKIRTKLIDGGIIDKTDFENAYTDFEVDAIRVFFVPKLSAYRIDEKANGELFFNSIGFKEYFFNIPISFIENSDLIKNHFYINSTIAKVITDFELGWKLDNDNPIGYKDLYENQHKYMQNVFTFLSQSLSKSLFQLSNNFHFFLQNSTVKRHFFISDENLSDSPFLDFGLKYISKDEEIEESLTFINTWLKEFDIADSITVKPITLKSEILGVSFYLKKGNKEYPIGDSGKGINQLLYILLRIASIGKNKIFTLEEPETNMHPALQSKLADMLIMAHNKFEISFIIETHSEYLIRRFQLLIARSAPLAELYNEINGFGDFDFFKYRAESMRYGFNEEPIIEYDKKLKKLEQHKKNLIKKLSEYVKYRKVDVSSAKEFIVAPNELSIYYLYDPKKIPKGRKQVEKLEVRADGILKQDFGEGFFDESTRLTMGLLTMQNSN